MTILLDKDLTKPLEWAASQWLTILTVIAALGPQKPVNAQVAAMADLASVIGFTNKPQTIAALTLLVPFFKTPFFQIGSIV